MTMTVTTKGVFRMKFKIEAVSLPSARKRAREISEHCVYGSMELLDIEMEA